MKTRQETLDSETKTPYDMGELCYKSDSTVSSLEKANEAFERSGSWPFNPNVYTVEHSRTATTCTEQSQEEVSTMRGREEENEEMTGLLNEAK